MEPEIIYAIFKLCFKEPPSPHSWGKALSKSSLLPTIISFTSTHQTEIRMNIYQKMAVALTTAILFIYQNVPPFSICAISFWLNS